MFTQITNMVHLATCRRPGRSIDKGYEVCDVKWRRGVLKWLQYKRNSKVYTVWECHVTNVPIATTLTSATPKDGCEADISPEAAVAVLSV